MTAAGEAPPPGCCWLGVVRGGGVGAMGSIGDGGAAATAIGASVAVGAAATGAATARVGGGTSSSEAVELASLAHAISCRLARAAAAVVIDGMKPPWITAAGAPGVAGASDAAADTDEALALALALAATAAALSRAERKYEDGRRALRARAQLARLPGAAAAATAATSAAATGSAGVLEEGPE